MIIFNSNEFTNTYFLYLDMFDFLSDQQKNILLAILPKTYWIAFLILLPFALIQELSLGPVNTAFNLILITLGIRFAVFIHEIGHLVFAQLFGGIPKRLVLGNGHKVFESKYKGVKIILNSRLNSGLAYTGFKNLKFIRLKLLIFTSGGFITNFITAGILFLFFGFSTGFYSGIQLISTLIIANILIGCFALVPYYSMYNGVSLYSDGLSILRIPFIKKEELLELNHVNELLDAYELVESKQYKQALSVYEAYIEKTNNSKSIQINLSIIYQKLSEYDKAIRLLEELVPLVDQKPYKRFKHYIFNNLAWAYLLTNRIEEADKYSEMAYAIDSNTVYIRGTRGCVLIESGQLQKGMDILKSEVNTQYRNSQTLTTALYMGYALIQVQKTEEAKFYMEFVKHNIDVLDTDDLLLYNRILNRTS